MRSKACEISLVLVIGFMAPPYLFRWATGCPLLLFPLVASLHIAGSRAALAKFDMITLYSSNVTQQVDNMVTTATKSQTRRRVGQAKKTDTQIDDLFRMDEPETPLALQDVVLMRLEAADMPLSSVR